MRDLVQRNKVENDRAGDPTDSFIPLIHVCLSDPPLPRALDPRGCWMPFSSFMNNTHHALHSHTLESLPRSLASESCCSPACWMLPSALRGQQDPRGGTHLMATHGVFETRPWHLVSQQIDDSIFISRWDPQRGGPTQLSSQGQL